MSEVLSLPELPVFNQIKEKNEENLNLNQKNEAKNNKQDTNEDSLSLSASSSSFTNPNYKKDSQNSDSEFDQNVLKEAASNKESRIDASVVSDASENITDAAFIQKIEQELNKVEDENIKSNSSSFSSKQSTNSYKKLNGNKSSHSSRKSSRRNSTASKHSQINNSKDNEEQSTKTKSKTQTQDDENEKSKSRTHTQDESEKTKSRTQTRDEEVENTKSRTQTRDEEKENTKSRTQTQDENEKTKSRTQTRDENEKSKSRTNTNDENANKNTDTNADEITYSTGVRTSDLIKENENFLGTDDIPSLHTGEFIHRFSHLEENQSKENENHQLNDNEHNNDLPEQQILNREAETEFAHLSQEQYQQDTNEEESPKSEKNVNIQESTKTDEYLKQTDENVIDNKEHSKSNTRTNESAEEQNHHSHHEEDSINHSAKEQNTTGENDNTNNENLDKSNTYSSHHKSSRRSSTSSTHSSHSSKSKHSKSSRASNASKSSKASSHSKRSSSKKSDVDSLLELEARSLNENNHQVSKAEATRFFDEHSVSKQLEEDNNFEKTKRKKQSEGEEEDFVSEKTTQGDELIDIESGIENITDDYTLTIISGLKKDLRARFKEYNQTEVTIAKLEKQVQEKDKEIQEMKENSNGSKTNTITADSTDFDSESVHSIAAAVSSMKRDSELTKQQLEEINNEIIDLKKAIEIKNEEILSKENNIQFLKNQKKSSTPTEDVVSQLNEENYRLTREKTFLVDRLTRIKTKRKTLREKVDKLNERSIIQEKLNSESVHADEQIKPTTKELTSVEKQVQELLQENDKLRKCLEQKQQDLDYKNLISMTRMRKDKKFTLLKLSRQKISDNEHEIEQLKEELDKLTQELNSIPQPFPEVPPLYPPMKSPYAK